MRHGSQIPKVKTIPKEQIRHRIYQILYGIFCLKHGPFNLLSFDTDFETHSIFWRGSCTKISSMFSLTAMGRQEKTKTERQILFSRHDSGDKDPKVFLDESKRGENSRPDVSRLLALFLPTQDDSFLLNNSQNRGLGFVRVHTLYPANRKLSPEIMGHH